MPRPTKKLTSDQIAQVEALAGFLTVEQIADYLGVGRTTFFNIMERQSEVSERYKKGLSIAVADIAGNLVEKARSGDMTAIIFFLKTRAGWKESQKVELTGDNGGPVEITKVTRRIIDPQN